MKKNSDIEIYQYVFSQNSFHTLPVTLLLRLITISNAYFGLIILIMLFLLSLFTLDTIYSSFLLGKETSIYNVEKINPEIKVLIVDKNTPYMPDKDEDVTKIGSLKGKLIVSGTYYKGAIEVYKGEKSLYIINILPVEDYIKSVVMAEVAEDWDYEALKAQAVIARTYAINHIINNHNSIYHLTSSTLHQMYNGNYFNDMVSIAVDETTGEILTYDENPIIAYYHSTCGGRTELPDEVFKQSYPYLKSVKDDCTSSPLYMWERKIPFKEIEDSLHLPNIKNIIIYSYTKTGRAATLKIESIDGISYIESKELRRILGWRRVPSTKFKVKNSLESDSDQQTLILEGFGYGHGVGLCQWGALQMSKDGKTYKEILNYYYPNTILKRYSSYLKDR